MAKRPLLFKRAGNACLTTEFDHMRRPAKVGRGQNCREKKDSVVACNLIRIFCTKMLNGGRFFTCSREIVHSPVMEAPQCICRSVVAGPRFPLPKRGSMGCEFQTGKLLFTPRPTASRSIPRFSRSSVLVEANLFSRVARIFR